jgi:hypothetical protein
MSRGRLALVFGAVFLVILAATSWATAQMPFWQTPERVVTHPWFIATLVDTYLAFFTFWLGSPTRNAAGRCACCGWC